MHWTAEDLIMTPRLQRIIGFAKEVAIKNGNEYVGVEHLLMALAQEKEGLHTQAGIDWEKVEAAALRELEHVRR